MIVFIDYYLQTGIFMIFVDEIIESFYVLQICNRRIR